MVRCFNEDVPEEFALITKGHPEWKEYYHLDGSLKEKFWALPRWNMSFYFNMENWNELIK